MEVHTYEQMDGYYSTIQGNLKNSVNKGDEMKLARLKMYDL